jgi:hypothetical protein
MEVLEKIEPGQKLSFKCGKVEIVDNPSRIGRWLSGENKHTTLRGVTDIVEAAMSSGSYISSKVLSGLENLKVTYSSSKTMGTRLTELQERIRMYMAT